MADRNFEKPLTLGKRRVSLVFTIAPNGTGTPTVTEDKGKALDATTPVARTGVGLWTLKLKDKYKAFLGLTCGVRLNAYAAGTEVQVTGAPDVGSARTIPITIAQGGAAADIAAHANNQLTFVVELCDSSVAR